MIDHYSVPNKNYMPPVEAYTPELTPLNPSHLNSWQEGLAAAATAYPEAFVLSEAALEEVRRYFFTA